MQRIVWTQLLPPKPEGYDNFYLLARGFNEFIGKLVRGYEDNDNP